MNDRIPTIWKEKDPYQILGVPKDASNTVIRTALDQKTKEWHPDRHKMHAPDIRDFYTEQMKAVNEARPVLLKPTKRAQYDRFRASHNPSQHTEDESQHDSTTNQRERQRQHQEQRNRHNDRKPQHKVAAAKASSRD